MFKVIIADDERVQREGIAKHGNWPKYGMQVSGLAEDGLSALELIRSSGADLLLTDIKMPNMNGLELAEQAIRINPKLKIIIISGYDDFEYARSAINLKAYAYLLKPISVDKLNEMLEQISSQCQAERQTHEELVSLKRQLEDNKPVLIEKFLENALHGFLTDEETIRERTAMLSVPNSGNGYRLMLIQHHDDGGMTDIEVQLTDLQIHRQLIGLFMYDPRVFVIRSKQYEYAFLIYNDDADDEPIKDVAAMIRTSIKLPANCSLTIGVSAPKKDLTQLNEAYKESESAARQKFYLGKGTDIYYQDIVPIAPIAVNYDLPFERMIQAVEIGNILQTEISCVEIWQVLSDTCHHPNPPQAIKAFCYRTIGEIYRIIHERNEKVEMIWSNEPPLWEHIHHLETLPEIREWLTGVVVTTAAHIIQKRSKKNSGIVESIIQTLEQHYHEEITIEALAKQVYLTPNYISNIFKESVGESIIEYLTKVRMKHAKRMLQDKSNKIYEIAEKTGYNSTSYFSVVFKGMYGISPKEYRDSLVPG